MYFPLAGLKLYLYMDLFVGDWMCVCVRWYIYKQKER